MPYPMISVTDAPYAVAPAIGQMGYFGKVVPKKPYTPSPAFQKMLATVAERKAARCARRQQRVQSMCAQSQARLASKNFHPRKLARLTAALSRRCTRQNTVLSKHCVASAALTTAPTNPNAVDTSSYNSDMADWNDCMAGQTTCATDDCGLQTDCNDPNNFDPDKAGCIADWKSCMADDKTCATDWCGDKPVKSDYTFANEGLSGFGAFNSNNLLLIGGALLIWFFLRKKK